MTLLSLVWGILSLASLVRSTAATGPQVNLGYATYEGTSLSNGVNQFLGMRYAAPPTGNNRFRLAQPPQPQHGVVDAKAHGAVCLGVQGLAFGSAPVPLGEDCLFIDVYTPSNATRAGAGGLPVMLWVQGGGFVQLFNPNYNGTGLIEASGANAIVVTFNYRVGSYGFLASTELEAEGNLNVGLHDQRAAMHWVQQHIAAFGGNPDKVTLFGTSAGGGSVLLQLLAYGGAPPAEDQPQWQAGIAESLFVPQVMTVKDLEFQYCHLLEATNCTSLACLRSLDSTIIQDANFATPFPGKAALPLFPYGPVVDNKLFNDTPTAMLKAGAFAKDRPLLLGSSHTEGTVFVPQANTTDDVSAFMGIQYPDLTSNDLAKLNDVYANVSVTFSGVTASEAPLYYHLAKMYGDAGFACPTLDFASELSKAGVTIYLFRDSILDPAEVAAGYIVPHTWEVQAVWGPDNAVQYVALPTATGYDVGGVNRPMVATVQAYWTSFARTGGDPNQFKAGDAPTWERFEGGGRLRLQTNATAMERVERWEAGRCAAWQAVSQRTNI